MDAVIGNFESLQVSMTVCCHKVALTIGAKVSGDNEWWANFILLLHFLLTPESSEDEASLHQPWSPIITRSLFSCIPLHLTTLGEAGVSEAAIHQQWCTWIRGARSWTYSVGLKHSGDNGWRRIRVCLRNGYHIQSWLREVVTINNNAGLP